MMNLYHYRPPSEPLPLTLVSGRGGLRYVVAMTGKYGWQIVSRSWRFEYAERQAAKLSRQHVGTEFHILPLVWYGQI